jgi:hypothetical protein
MAMSWSNGFRRGLRSKQAWVRRRGFFVSEVVPYRCKTTRAYLNDVRAQLDAWD